MADNEIVIEIKGKLDVLEKQLEDLKSTAEKQGTAIGAGLVGGITAALATKGLVLISRFTDTITGAFTSAIHEASEAQKAIQLFNSSLAIAGNFSREASARFQEYAAQLQSVTGVSDDLIISNASILASLGRLSGEGLNKATAAAVNFSATGRVSLETAFDLIAKAANGSTETLGRYGIKIREGIPDSEKFAAVLAQIEQRFGGLAAAQINTFAGALQLVKVNFNDVLENIGKLITQSPVLVAFIKLIGERMKEFADSLKGVSSGDIIGTLIKQLLSFGQTITSHVIAPLEFMFRIGVVGFNSIKTAVSLFATALAEIPLFLVDIISKVLDFGSVVGKVVGLFNENFGNKIQAGLQSASQSLANFSTNARGALEDTFVASAQQTGESFNKIFDFTTSTGISDFITQLQSVAEQAIPLGDGIKNNIGGAFNAVSDTAAKAAASINKNFQQGVLNVISAGAQAIGASLVKGGKAFDNFKNQVLSIIGDMAIQIGTTLVGIGIGIEALKLALGTLTGGVAIAAGLALIAVGGLLKSLSGGAGGAEGTGVGGGVGTPAGGAPVGGGAFGEPELLGAQQGNKVTVNIQGNVLDRRESGLEIANIIQEHFNINGQVLAGGTV